MILYFLLYRSNFCLRILYYHGMVKKINIDGPSIGHQYSINNHHISISGEIGKNTFCVYNKKCFLNSLFRELVAKSLL